MGSGSLPGFEGGEASSKTFAALLLSPPPMAQSVLPRLEACGKPIIADFRSRFSQQVRRYETFAIRGEDGAALDGLPGIAIPI